MRLASRLAAALLLAAPALASEEDHLPWRSVGVDCFEHAQTGKVSVKARAGAQGVSSFVLHAFGKDHALSKAQLRQIGSFPLESLQVTREAGYAELGGHTVHARLRKGEETARVTVTKAKGLQVSVDRTALYDRLERDCSGRLSPGCCAASVEAMRKGGFALAAPDGSCPAGTAPDMMRCKDSFRWCAPGRGLAPPVELLRLTERGGLCPYGGCRTELVIKSDGRYAYREGQPLEAKKKGRVAAEDAARLASLIKEADFAAIKARPFTGTCPTALDAPERTYAFTTAGGGETIAACTYAVDAEHPLFKLADELAAGVHARRP